LTSLLLFIDHVNPFYQKLFETGVDEMSWDDMDEMQVSKVNLKRIEREQHKK